MQTGIKIFIDASFCDNSRKGAWGAYFRCPETKERFNIHGKLDKTVNSTHAEIQAIKETLAKAIELRKNKDMKFIIYCDCKSITDLFNQKANSKCKNIRTEYREIIEKFGEVIATVNHINGHSDKNDVSENAVGNRRAHHLAYNTLRAY